ncbi:MAG TPA: peptidogalycan biosysnthesis protein, partial [Sphingomicrobium sp.]|nr:peptidogalycan biosysnthesis protein [Sphingomicrobium sp.]
MADREAEIVARIARGVSDLPPEQWDGLAGGRDPFLGHAFLSLLERSGSVGEGTGWTALPIMVERAGRITAAAPAYLKTHSQGEYVFDHGWADAWERAGGDYYPKLQVAVPFTPCVGPRLLGDDGNALLAALETVTIQNGLSSAHITFLPEDDVKAAERRGWLRRDGLQFHWLNHGYAGFDDFLAALSSRKRKAIRKERTAANQGVEIVELRGSEIRSDHWEAMWNFYQHTGARKWGRPYLTRAFFDLVGEEMGDSAL